MPDPEETVVGSPLDDPGPMPIGPVPNREGAGVHFPPRGSRNIAHADPGWYEQDLDQPFDDPDDEQVDPMPTERYFRVP